MSKLSENVYALLKRSFPHYTIIKEYYVPFKGTRLFFDFYVKELGILIEAQGRQHDEFVKHFHTDACGFMESKRRDNLKLEYCEHKELVLITFDDSDKLTEKCLLNKVWSKMTS